MDGSPLIMEGSLLSIFLLLQWMVALSLWKVVCYRYFVTPMDGTLSLWKVVPCLDFVTPLDGSLVIMKVVHC